MHVQSANCLLFSKKPKKEKIKNRGQGSGKCARYMYKLQWMWWYRMRWCKVLHGTRWKIIIATRIYCLNVLWIVWNRTHASPRFRFLCCTPIFTDKLFAKRVCVFMCHNFTFQFVPLSSGVVIAMLFAWKLSCGLFDSVVSFCWFHFNCLFSSPVCRAHTQINCALNLFFFFVFAEKCSRCLWVIH